MNKRQQKLHDILVEETEKRGYKILVLEVY